MSVPIKLVTQRDFRGGLNLRADAFELGDDESPDLLNVDIDPRGGVEMRQGVTIQAATIGNPNLFTNDESTAYATAPAMLLSNVTGARETVAPPLIGVTQLPANWLMTATVAAQGFMSSNARKNVTAGQTYSGFAYCQWTVGTPKTCTMRIDWYNAGAGFISSTTGAGWVPSASSFSQGSVSGVAPAGAVTALCILIFGGVLVIGDKIRVAGLSFAFGSNQTGWLDATAVGMPGEFSAFGKLEAAGGTHIMAVAGSHVLWSVAGTTVWYDLGIWNIDSSFVQFKDKLYIFGNTGYTLTWDFTTAVVLAGTWNDNLAAPTGLYAPAAKYGAAFQGSLWCANTTEVGVNYPNRVRWSHPNQPGDFRSFDYIDVDTGVDGDIITALVPLEDKILVFKRRSVYAIQGTGPESFSVYPISRTVGALHQGAVAATDMGVFFFSWPEGVFLFDGKQVRWQSERIIPLITEGLVDVTKSSLIRLGWSGRRLWVAVPWRASILLGVPTANTRVYLLDPTLSKEGSWTVYDLPVSTMFKEERVGITSRLIGAIPNLGRFQVLESPGTDQPFDTLAAGTIHINSYYTTPWYDLKQPSIHKRWRHPEFVVRSVNAITTLLVEVRKNYDSSIAARRFDLLTSIDSGSMNWGDPWGEVWGGSDATSPRSEVLRGPTLGQARAVQLKINGPTTVNKHWGLNAISLKYTPKPLRS